MPERAEAEAGCNGAPRSSAQEYAHAVDAWARHAMAPNACAVGACQNMELIRVAKLIATEGPGSALARLHPDVAFSDGGLRWSHDDGSWTRQLDRPLLLLPVFTRSPTAVRRQPARRACLRGCRRGGAARAPRAAR